MWVISLAVLVSSVGGSVAWAVHLFRIASRDSLELAAKLATPHPRRAADWPELQLDEVVFDPAAASRVLLVARWPAILTGGSCSISTSTRIRRAPATCSRTGAPPRPLSHRPTAPTIISYCVAVVRLKS